MSTRRYYFCHACGSDTATYEPVSACPYCHAKTPTLRLVDELEGGEHQSYVADIAREIGTMRRQWLKQNPGKTLGAPVTKRSFWPFHRKA